MKFFPDLGEDRCRTLDKPWNGATYGAVSAFQGSRKINGGQPGKNFDCPVEQNQCRPAGRMGMLLAAGIAAALAPACGGTLHNRDKSIQAAASSPDRQADSTPIEDCILALPAFRFHEESVEQFTARIRAARELPRNQDKGPDFLYCGGDGAWGPREFVLDRSSRTLTVRIPPNTLPPPEGDGSVTVMRQISGKWTEIAHHRVSHDPASSWKTGNSHQTAGTSAPLPESQPFHDQ